MIDPYFILGVNTYSSIEEIKTAYLKLVKSNHPDVGESEEKMKIINQALVNIKNIK